METDDTLYLSEENPAKLKAEIQALRAHRDAMAEALGTAVLFAESKNNHFLANMARSALAGAAPEADRGAVSG